MCKNGAPGAWVRGGSSVGLWALFPAAVGAALIGAHCNLSSPRRFWPYSLPPTHPPTNTPKRNILPGHLCETYCLSSHAKHIA